MNINFLKSADLKSVKKSVLVVSASEEMAQKGQNQFILKAKELTDFKGKSGQIFSIPSDDDLIIVVGIGSVNKFDNLSAQKLGGKISAYLNGIKVKDATIMIGYDLDDKNNFKSTLKNSPELIANLAFGIRLQSYRFNKYFNAKKEGKEIILKNVNLVCEDLKEVNKRFEALELIAESVFFTRDLVSEPSNILNPESYAKICETLRKEGVQVEVFGEAEMKKLGMNSLLGVGQGSDKESKMVIFKWNGAKNKKAKEDSAPIAIVGKGVTFDTGGISIKPSANMEDMKTDMAGSAVVVGLMRLLARRNAQVNVVGAIGLVENMPSGTAQRPGDVVKSMSGQTIEVINTDAEGRLVLADVLHYTNATFRPKLIIDLATLTGAIIIALADVHAGLFSNDDELSNRLIEAGKKTGETLWRLPLGEEYDDMINSDIADMKNVGSGRGAGSVTAAQFLKRFVGNTKWAHLDIAGVAWKGKGNPLAVKGASGYGVRLLNQMIEDCYEGK